MNKNFNSVEFQRKRRTDLSSEIEKLTVKEILQKYGSNSKPKKKSHKRKEKF